jgi:hypothetical protein
MTGRAAGDETDLEDHLVDILTSVQWFICNGAKLAWPSNTPVPSWPSDPSRGLVDRHATELVALVPHAEASVADGVVNLWWEKDGTVVLALEPIPLARV